MVLFLTHPGHCKFPQGGREGGGAGHAINLPEMDLPNDRS